MEVISLDIMTKEQRRKTMSHIKAKDTRIELLLRRALWQRGYRYRKNYKKLPGTPDIVLTKYRVAIFCDSEFFHGYNWDYKKQHIETNKSYWIKKIERNINRDKKVNQELQDKGWRVIRFWGKEITKDVNECVETIEDIIDQIKLLHIVEKYEKSKKAK